MKSYINLHDFASAFGVEIKDLPKSCIEAYEKLQYKFSYDVIEGEERDRLIVEILKKIEADTQKIGSPERTAIWQKGWQENLDLCLEKKEDDAIRPKYYKPLNVMRWNNNYIKPHSPNFEMDYLTVLQQWLFSYFEPYNNIYEFGCGSGINLCTLAKMYSGTEKHIWGSDFVPSAVKLANKWGEIFKGRISGFQFDMINPNFDRELIPNSAVLLSGALEQLASKFESFFEYLLENKPGICVFIEPIVEVYDDKDLMDYLAVKFHRKRGYTEGIMPWLLNKQKEHRVEILKIKRQNIGSMFFEGWTIIIWKPI